MNEISMVPVWPKFIGPILQTLAAQSTGSQIDRTTLRHGVFALLELTPEAQGERLESGQRRADNRMGWALTSLVKNNLVDRPERARYAITVQGRDFLRTHPEGLSNASEAHLHLDAGWQAEKISNPLGEKPGSVGRVEDTEEDPFDQIESGVAKVNAEVATTLLMRLRESDPDFFEQAVVDVLISMGYGGAEGRGKRIGGTGDGGVDGVIDQDALGLDQIYVQAKRYALGNNISGDSIRAFIGAVQSRGASRGVFITTSAFTPAAIQESARSRYSRIVLVDGVRLAALMIAYRVGVQVRQNYAVVELDEDFFD